MARKPKKDMGILEVEKPPRVSPWAWLRNRFFAGMVIAAPIVVTFSILQFFITYIDSRVVPWLPEALRPQTYLNYAVPGFGLIVLVLFLTILGAITTNLIGRSVVGLMDRALSRIPIVRTVYSAFKQIVDVFANNPTEQFQECVLIEFPKQGTWCLGFLAAPARGEIKTVLGEEFIGVFVPTTPNPTSGFIMYVKAEEVIRMHMSVEEGARMILSAGLVVPEHPEVKAALEAVNGKKA
ncbi:MAG TPA: DUF502 domain-containing protein [Hyphomonas sp.]|nr:DUF502 domain-containing protein [Hyphomonas sp.]MCA8904389.1 DUF502 domain-containing protein [Hyphomonas sp.]MCB9961431.1 DUF502 domain-containing protein [Hyphomonas sp.]MCB9971607.1 DUF502 domain-containing protein [Hyphomonas sp.]HPE47234.1 DUF502 domain-containing protein [Hyphomonas sp.]